MNPTRVFISLGSNLGDRLLNLSQAQAALHTHVVVVSASSVYETEPWGYSQQPPFLNQVVEADTLLSPSSLLEALKGIEADMGRTPSIRYGPRLIDLDILFYGEMIIRTPTLTVPHPQLHARAFVLVPLAEIAPGFAHPVFGMTVSQLLASVDAYGVRPYHPNPQ